MIRFFKRGSRKAGLPPGTLIHTGEPATEEVTLSVIQYNAEEMTSVSATELSEAVLTRPAGKVVWINMDGIHRVEMIERIGKAFGIHPLTLEDVVNTGQRPKLESYDTYLFIVLKMLYLDETVNEVWETASSSLSRRRPSMSSMRSGSASGKGRGASGSRARITWPMR